MAEEVILNTADGNVATHAMTEADGSSHSATGHSPDPAALGMTATAWVSLAMAVFIAVLIWKKVPSAIAGALDGKIAAIRAQLDEASKLRQEAEALKAEYQAKLNAAAADAEAMLAKAQHDADQVLADAKTNAAALIARRQKMAEDKISAAERAAIADIRQRAVDAATGAAAALLLQNHDAKADKLLVDAAIKDLSTSH